MDLEFSATGDDAAPIRPAPPHDARDDQPQHPPRAVEANGTGLHQDGEGKPRRHAGTTESVLRPAIWEAVRALAQREALSPFAIAVTSFALLLERLAGGPVPFWAATPLKGGESASPAAGQTMTLVRGIPAMPGDSLIAATRRLGAAGADAATDVPATGTPACCLLFEGGDQPRREAPETRVTQGAVRWPGRSLGAPPDWDLKLVVRLPAGAQPGVLRLVADAASFRLPRARALLAAYCGLLDQVLAAPHAPLASIPLAAAHDRARVWPAAIPAAPCALRHDTPDMATLFDAIVRRWPAAPAIVWQGGAMTFADVARSAEALAATLHARGATAADVIAFRLTSEAHPRGRALFVATQIAAFRIGCALLPLGQQLPAVPARRQIEALGARFVVAATPELDCAPGWTARAHRTALDGFPGAFLLASPHRAPSRPDDTALLLTSSGSTGVPKTIRLSQAMLIGMLHAVAATGLIPPLPHLMGQNIGFDITVHDVWMPWLFGRHLVVLNTERRTPQALADAVALGAGVVSLSPTVATAALNAGVTCFAGLHTLLLIGEVLPLPLVRRLMAAAPQLRLVNGYGPTEAAVLATLADVTRETQANVPVGAALPGYRVLIVDAELRPLPPHWPGEIAIACAAPALGYVDAAMTAARFVALPGEAPGPFFRTGDLGWIDENGMVRFSGRRDRQVKLHGVRLELDGVEHLIAQVDGVADVGVVVSPGPLPPRIVAVVQPASNAPGNAVLTARILAHCQALLPRAAVPAEFCFVAAMPMGPTGKKSHTALQNMVARNAGQDSNTADPPALLLADPRSFEARLAGLWQAQLAEYGVRSGGLDLDADLFALGATSLDALCMAERFEHTFGVAFPDHQIFVRRTIRQQAALLHAAHAPARSTAPSAGEPTLSLQLVRAAYGAETSRGVVLGMPMLAGGNRYLGVIGANALKDYDIWGFTIKLDGRSLLDDDDRWIDCARAIADRLLAADAIRPRALIGFSLGGLIGWLVDRYLVAAGRDPTPMINLDGGSLATGRHARRGTTAPPLPQGSDMPSGRMLVVQRGAKSRFANPMLLDADWAGQGVTLDVLHCRTVCHEDFARPELFIAADAMLGRYIETGKAVAEPASGWVDVDTPGGALFGLLELQHPPCVARLRTLVAGLPSGKIDHDLRVGLLFLALAAGDADWALALARRLCDEDPNFRAAVYAQVAVLAELGRLDEAAAIAGGWCKTHAPDLAMEQRALRKTMRPLEAELARNLYAGNVNGALDVAAASCAPPVP